ncbi:uncharacterized protein LOC126439531 [Schistocerca serialis cubense]|uniref:uncharacterized protein LOC126439531 n=1 Tax=Schistocerca serialis cubense TaxID=2023355 RepID=UPI00214F0F59|nr:uncharacterized protein LOC126439531 [Schistocerca serialis cubense]
MAGGVRGEGRAGARARRAAWSIRAVWRQRPLWESAPTCAPPACERAPSLRAERPAPHSVLFCSTADCDCWARGGLRRPAPATHADMDTWIPLVLAIAGTWSCDEPYSLLCSGVSTRRPRDRCGARAVVRPHQLCHKAEQRNGPPSHCAATTQHVSLAAGYSSQRSDAPVEAEGARDKKGNITAAQR